MNHRILFLVALLSTAGLSADEITKNVRTQGDVNAMTRSYGAILGGGLFHSGKALGFPLGIDLGYQSAFVDTKHSGTLSGGHLQLEIGLPARINLIGRVGKIYGANTYGGGVRSGLYTSAVPAIPSVSVIGLYNKAKDDDYSASTYSGDMVLSFAVPYVHPYIGMGFNHTRFELADSAPTAAGLEASRNGNHIEVGLNLSLIPFTYITVGGGFANSDKIFHLGAGARF